MKSLVAIVVFALVAVTGASAQNYPTRPVLLIVPYPPGGMSDAVGRPVAEGMQGYLGQTIVIENVGGANGSIGSGRVARATPDGYTLLLGIWNTHVAIAKLLKLDYDVVKDFAPIAFMTDAPLLLNTRFQTVHCRGAGPITQDLLGGQIQIAFLNPATAAPHVRSGVIKALGVTGAHRMTILPDVPTMAEAGFQGGMEFSLWSGLYAPKGTPKKIIDTLNHAVVADYRGCRNPAAIAAGRMRRSWA